MPLFPAAKYMDMVIGVDVHAVAPVPGIPIHPYVGPVYLWATPVFPSINVFINGMPACSVGAMGYFFHIPQGVPIPPTPTNVPYWRRYLVNIPMVLTLTALTVLANMAIAGISALVPKPKSVENFIKDVTGIDTTSRAATWESIKGMFAQYTQWQTWAKLLMPPLPYPGAQGSVAVGSPSVTVNGGPLAFVGPLLATSCSDIPVVPNACTLGFSNVMVGVSFADLVRGIAVSAAQQAVQAAVQKGMDHALAPDEENAPPPGEGEEPGKPTHQNDDCDRPGHPVNPVTGASESEFTDILIPNRFRWDRNLSSARCGQDGPLGFGMRHGYQHDLVLGADRATYVDPRGRHAVFPRGADGRYGKVPGLALEELGDGRFALHHGPEGTLGFARDPASPGRARLAVRVRDGLREALEYDGAGRLVRVRQTFRRPEGKEAAEVSFVLDDAGRIAQVLRDSGSGPLLLASYGYDAAGCLVQVVDALGGVSSYAYDAERRVLRETDANGYSFHFQYDALGRCTGSAGDDGLWRVALRYAPGRTLVTEADNALWTFTFDEAGTVTEVLDPYGGTRRRVTGPDGRVLQDIDSGGRITTLLYDAQGRNTGRLDRWGNVWPSRDQAPNLPNPLAHTVPGTALEREWGAVPNQTTKLPPLPPEVESWLAQQQEPGKAAGEQHDLRGRLLRRTDALGQVETFNYDPAGNLIAFTDKDGALHRREFASWNLCVAATDPLGHTTRFRHTRREKLAAVIDPGGSESKYIYDGKDRLSHVFRHGVLRERYRYDEGDRVIEKQDGDGAALLTFTIGPAGLASSRTLSSGEVHSFAYDRFGNVTEASTDRAKVLIGYRDGIRVSDTRDGRGIVHRHRNGTLTATTLFDTFTTRYETLGPGDVLVHPPCGPAHRLQRSADGQVLLSLGHGLRVLGVYDAERRCTGRASWRGVEEPGWTAAYNYSGTGELRWTEDSEHGRTQYTYDAAHRLTGQHSPGQSLHYAYDPAGNLVSTPTWPELRCAEGNRLEAAGGARFGYDARNHLAEMTWPDGAGWRFTYNSMDLLVRIEASGNAQFQLWEAEYDGLCRRTAKIVDGRRTEYAWDGDRLAAETAPDGSLRQYVYPDLVALIPFMFVDYPGEAVLPADGRPFFVIHDQVGMPLRIEDAAGSEVWRADVIEPYGSIVVAPGATCRYDLRFPGHLLDPETGLHCNRFRSYSPSLCRYLQSDPAGQSGGVNLYGYAPNPVVQVDVLGLAHDKAKPGTNESADQTGPHEKAHADGDGHSHGTDGKGKYPPRTDEATQACRDTRKALNEAMTEQKMSPKKEPHSISVYTHEDGTKSVGMSGPQAEQLAPKVQDKLNNNDPNGPYKVSGKTDPELDKSLQKDPNRNTAPGNCAEPRAASAAHDNDSPITGFDTTAPPTKDNTLNKMPDGQYDPAKPEQMKPCPNCDLNEDPINQWAQGNKGKGS